jgi:hypothetical protein
MLYSGFVSLATEKRMVAIDNGTCIWSTKRAVSDASLPFNKSTIYTFEACQSNIEL